MHWFDRAVLLVSAMALMAYCTYELLTGEDPLEEMARARRQAIYEAGLGPECCSD